jgi:uncharacterized protein (DUF58 family)
MIQESDIINAGNLDFLAKQVVEGFITGLHKSPYHGFSVEFAEHRQYNQGQSTRNIDWKLYARTERLFVKRYEEETNLRCYIVLDASSSMNFPEKGNSKLQNAVLWSASLMKLIKRNRDAVGLIQFGQGIKRFTDVKSSNSHHSMLMKHLSDMLEEPQVNQTTDVVSTLHEVAERIHKRSMVVIFSDMFDGTNEDAVFDALQHLKFNKHEVILFHTVHHGMEIDLNFENRPYTFEDLETGERMKLYPSEIQTEYVKTMNDKIKRLKAKCTQYKIDFVEADVSKSADQIFIPFLVKRQRMRV